MVGRLRSEVGKREPFSCPEQEAHLNVMRTADVLHREVEERVLTDAGLSDAQYNVLRILRGAGESGLPCGEIAQRMIRRDPDITRLLDRLAARGLVDRNRDDRDRRIVRVTLTAKGREILDPIDGPLLAAHRRAMACLDQGELRSLIELLERIRASLDNPGDDPGSAPHRAGADAATDPTHHGTQRSTSS